MADTKVSALPAAGAALLTHEFPVNEGGASKKDTLQQVADLLLKRISGTPGAAGEYKTLQRLSANAAANATTILATVMATTALQPGTYHFRYTIVYQAAATTTGVAFAVNFTGTQTKLVWSSWFATSGGAAATALADQQGSNTASLCESKASRTANTKGGSSLGVDTANADCLMHIEGVIVVTVAGDLELRHASELAASTQVMADTLLELTKHN